MKVRSWVRAMVVSASAVLSGCGESGAASDPEPVSSESSAVVSACYALCEAQGEGEGCTPAFVERCRGFCDLRSEKTGDCADATVARLECEAELTWSCPSDKVAITIDPVCTAEEEAADAACQD